MHRRGFMMTGAAALTAPMLRAQSAGYAETAGGLDQLHALIVRQGGEEVFAEAFRGPGLDSIANIKSVSKTLVALLTGIAIDEGAIEGPEARVLPLLGLPDRDDAINALTVGDLLSMRTGLESTSGGNYGSWIASDNWVRAALAQDVVAEPGGRFIYSTGGWHVLGAVLSEVTGRSLRDLAQDRLGGPLDISFPPWARDPQGRFLGGNEMAVTPRGLSRIGQMVLDGGRWDDVEVVPERWIETSWERRARSPFSGDGYGYGWFLTRIESTPVRYGRGYGGQILAVAPEREIVIAITSDPTLPARSGGYFGALKSLMGEVLREV
ncbi:CubicO group peptidase, beta-lactamase class C family [Roseivivax halotolerans]|uniref:CubicO group peptidase, beta-lactamase class C family n=1 Tax=Roseivivax halotolerans TaxID=93684 RepID=A0A1I5X547_9RHOB|nr:serine hydrolase [Roseivivax halotolerans]SFQ27093.1 CubicO group peptidase, beta-lactamase class C family [Roseivivax halotolerans]